MGILDTYKVLHPNEVYCAIKRFNEDEKTVIDTKAFITKNHCLHPADIRKVICVSENVIKARLK